MNIFKILLKYYHRSDKLKKDIPELYEPELVNLLTEAIDKKIPFAAGKIGGFELWAMHAVLFCHQESQACEHLCVNAGFFPKDILKMKDFFEIMKHSLSEVDVLFKWQKHYESYFINKYCGSIQGIIKGNFLAGWSSENPWTQALKGKKVLVIHPFEDSIRSQYKKRQVLFLNPNILPEFELLTLKAVQSIGGECEEYSDWFAALDGMTKKIKKLDFDVAIIGCGAYGLPLAVRIKEMGKVAVHMGGDTQMLFGIKGKRWNSNRVAMQLFNEHWIYPSDAEKPKTAQAVEDGCYW